ncbi:hypothetical protein PF010_g1050 [Phytophthora fragariae]|uniref:Uncharacterized protein n=1 Tax=Phytophthora fragariae TaxID=53985 RepID=A0A6G0M246_9STRA|nr:hypothetical protein PF010_g1050 [Phytophthora fragariae]
MRVRPANRKQEEEHKSQGDRLSSVDQGDGSVVFKQLVNYLINKASAEYVWDTITRLNDLARARRVPESDNSLTQQEGSQVKEEERRTEWMDEMPEVLRNQFEWLMSYWNKNKINVQRLQQLMTTWIVEVNCKQDELETRLRCFTFVDNAESNKTDEDNEEKSTPKSYLGAVAKGLQPKDNSQSKELKKLYELCMTPMETLAVPRRYTEEEDRALLMILTHELEVPHPPRFLVQTMTGEEIARFIDIFKAIEYPLYAHLAPGQSQREEAKLTNAIVQLDYYTYTAVLRRGAMTSTDLYWLFATKLGLKVHTMAHTETKDTGMNDKQWRISIKAAASPPKLWKVGYIIIDDVELMIHHQEVYINWTCAKCGSPEHPNKYCGVAAESMEDSKAKHKTQVAGQLPSVIQKKRGETGRMATPTTLEELRAMIRGEVSEKKNETPEGANAKKQQQNIRTSPARKEKKTSSRQVGVTSGMGTAPTAAGGQQCKYN